ncbi:LysR family transcriptional regulator [Treponema sp. OttesenSCG-928-L16]|nr:LysR family transcriptional regulator [Treponema sp. OttesenSCG-928-L16]
MNTRSCEYFLAIAEKKTLSKAAAALGLSQPTLTNYLYNMERLLGHSLFFRHKKIMYPTRAGELYLDACRRIIEVKNRTYHSITALASSFTETFTIGITPHRGSILFGHIFPPFYHRFPDVRVDIKEGYVGALVDLIDTGEVDLVIGVFTPDNRKDFDIASHNEEDIFLCVPDFHPLAKRSSDVGGQYGAISIRQFQDTPFIMWGDQTMNCRIIRRHFEEQGFSPTVVFESNNALVIDSMLSSGVGVGFLPASYCKPGQDRVYFSVIPPIKNDIGILFRKGVELTKAQRYFMYLCIKNQLIHSMQSLPCLNERAKKIYDEFDEGRIEGGGDGHPTA